MSLYEDEGRDIIFILGGGTLMDRIVYEEPSRLIALEQPTRFQYA
jgi:hypothetical protein